MECRFEELNLHTPQDIQINTHIHSISISKICAIARNYFLCNDTTATSGINIISSGTTTQMNQ